MKQEFGNTRYEGSLLVLMNADKESIERGIRAYTSSTEHWFLEREL